MEKNELLRVFTPGGVLSPADLKKILTIAEDFGNDYVHFGSRQDILFPVNNNDRRGLHAIFKSIKTDFEYKGRKYQNITTSYVAFDIQPSTAWISSSIYYYIMDPFDYRPTLKINITDPRQSLVPLFSGNLNFIASPYDDYWYLYLNFPEFNLFQCWPVLVYSYDIAKVAKAIEDIFSLEYEAFSEKLFQRVNDLTQSSNRNISGELQLSFTPFSSYEGLNKMAGDQYWLGLYWRNNKFTINFLLAVCALCAETRVGKICITPWKSFIVKDIAGKDRIKWEKLCGRYGINMRHSSLELNWHLPVLDEEALQLKRYLVKNFDQNDISTEGLTFAVKTSPMTLFTSIVIEQKQSSRYAGNYDLVPSYQICYSKDFNPNTREYLVFAKDVEKEDLAPLLMELTKMYFEQLNNETETIISEKKPEIAAKKLVHQCSQCLTIYDEEYGDPAAGIALGVAFNNLPQDYLCPLCESTKKEFKVVEMVGEKETLRF